MLSTPESLEEFVEPDVYYKIVDAKVAHEIIDGEAIVIHFDTGNYYSLEGVSSQLWQWFASQASRRQILDAFQNLKSEEIQSLDDFIQSLVKEEILAVTAAGTEHQSASPLPKHEVLFQPPKFSKYNDMQNLLLSDPIHDTDETGWPNLEENSV